MPVINLASDPIPFFHIAEMCKLYIGKDKPYKSSWFCVALYGGRRKMNCSLSVSGNGIVRLIYVALLTLKIDSSAFTAKITLDFCAHRGWFRQINLNSKDHARYISRGNDRFSSDSNYSRSSPRNLCLFRSTSLVAVHRTRNTNMHWRENVFNFSLK